MIDWTAAVTCCLPRSTPKRRKLAGAGWDPDWPHPAPQPPMVGWDAPPRVPHRWRSECVGAAPPVRVRDPDEPRPEHGWYPPSPRMAHNPVGATSGHAATTVRGIVREDGALHTIDRGRRIPPAPGAS